MPLIMFKTYQIPDKYSEEEKEIYKDLIDQFRTRIGDDIPEKNVLHNKALRYPDGKVVRFINTAISDINGFGIPFTHYTLNQMYGRNPALMILGAMVNMCVSEGLFQAANGIDFSDSGLSIAMYNKTGIYQGWHGTLLQIYHMQIKDFKTGIIMSGPNAGFVGIGTEFGYRNGGGGYYY